MPNCDACNQAIQGAFIKYGQYAICQTCKQQCFATCDAPTVDAVCKSQTTDSKPALLTAGKKVFVKSVDYQGPPNEEIMRFCPACDKFLPKVVCDAGCGKCLSINNTNVGWKYGEYGKLSICQDCQTQCFSTCNASLVNVRCKDSTSDGKGKLLAAGKKVFAKGVTYSRDKDSIQLCPACDSALSNSKVKCSGRQNCNKVLQINNTLLLSGIVSGTKDNGILFCKDCGKSTAKCGSCNLLPVASQFAPVPTTNELFIGVQAPSFDGETHYRCQLCARTMLDANAIRDYYYKVQKLLATLLKSNSSSWSSDTKLEVVKHSQLIQEDRARPAKGTKGTPGTLGGFWTNDPRSMIFIEPYLSSRWALTILAHELTHAWHYVCKLKNFADSKTSEGFAQWVAYVVLRDYGTQFPLDPKEIDTQKKAIEQSPLSDYGDGFKAFQKLEASLQKTDLVIQQVLTGKTIDELLKK